jgi:hypothetical protein
MFFAHTIGDYNLQGILASMKTKDWWKERYPDSLYKYDYAISLIMHSISWTTCIFIPIMIYCNWQVDIPMFCMWILNIMYHAYTDHIKANAKAINLVTDQLIHTVQIICTWFIFVA